MRLSLREPLGRRFRQRQPNLKPRPESRTVAEGAHRSVVHFYESADDGQANTESSLRTIQ